jgi:hypothetical protein
MVRDADRKATLVGAEHPPQRQPGDTRRETKRKSRNCFHRWGSRPEFVTQVSKPDALDAGALRQGIFPGIGVAKPS